MKIKDFREKWVGRIFECQDTKERFIIPDDVTYGSFYAIGNCFIDVGDEFLHRISGALIEIKLKETK